MKYQKYITGALILLGISGCGNSYSSYSRLPVLQPVSNAQCTCPDKPAPVVSATPKPVVSVSPKPLHPQQPQTRKLSQEEAAKEVFQRVLKSITGIKTFKSTVHNYVKGNYYKKKFITEPKTAVTENYVVFERPRRMFLTIKYSSDTPSLLNTRAYFDGSSDMKVKVPGLLGLFTFTFPVDKPDMTNYRGYTTQDIDTVSLEKRLGGPGAKVKLLGTSTIYDTPVYMLEITSIETLDDKITREVLGVRKSDYIPLLHEMYEGEELVYQNKFENFEYNVPVSEDDFKF